MRSLKMVDNTTLENQKPRITVMGVGGAGGNAVNNMIRANLEGVSFMVANTDSQALTESLAERRLQLGVETTQGLGAGSKPQIGRSAAEEDIEEIQKSIKGSHMLFVTAGMGGGTGTGAAPVIASAAREMGILTVGVVTKPFNFEGAHRMRMAEEGIEEMQQVVDTLIIIPNQNLFRLANDRTTFADAFNMADNVLYSGVRGVTDLMIMPGLINLDFADVKTVMGEMGKAMMGTGEAEGENRAIESAEAAISNPLLDDVSMRGARGVLINITGGLDMTLFEVDEAANRIREEVDADANIIFGSTFDERLSGRMRVSVVATGIDNKNMPVKRKASHQLGEQMPLIRAPDGDSPLSRMGNSPGDALVERSDESRVAAEVPAQHQPFRQTIAAPERSPSFLERIGFKRRREEDTPSQEKNSSSGEEEPSSIEVDPEHNTLEAPNTSKEREQSMEASDRHAPEEPLDIPAFLRRKKN